MPSGSLPSTYVKITGTIGPDTYEQQFPLTDPQFGLGGIRTVGTTTEMEAIYTDRRQEGMIVYVSGITAYYALIGTTANSGWTTGFTFGKSVNNITNYVASFNGNTGAVQGVSSWNGQTGAVEFHNYVSSFNGTTGSVQGVSSVNGNTGAFGLSAGLGITYSVTGNTYSFKISYTTTGVPTLGSVLDTDWLMIDRTKEAYDVRRIRVLEFRNSVFTQDTPSAYIDYGTSPPADSFVLQSILDGATANTYKVALSDFKNSVLDSIDGGTFV